jgi:hypothetical protein
MGRIRSALRAYALETTDPAGVLTRLDRKAQLFEPGMMATVIYAVLDPTHTNLAWSNAGHPPSWVPVVPCGWWIDLKPRTGSRPQRTRNSCGSSTPALLTARSRQAACATPARHAADDHPGDGQRSAEV